MITKKCKTLIYGTSKTGKYGNKLDSYTTVITCER